MARENPPVPCANCGTAFTPYEFKDRPRYCSKHCIWVATKGPEYNAELGRKSAKKSGDTQRGRGEGKAYRKLNGRHEHRVVAEQMLGRPLAAKEIVHHKDGNILNNAPDNLAVMTQGEHMREHGIGIPGKPLTWEPWKYAGHVRKGKRDAGI